MCPPASSSSPTKYVLPRSFDPDEFLADVKAAKSAVGDATEADARHLESLVLKSRVLVYGGHVLLLAGIAQAWGTVAALCCTVAAIMISTARCMNWTIIGHHVSHGGYDKLVKSYPGVLPSQYKRGVFGVGLRRFFDWLDWMLPQAWDVEHNKLHHYYLSEDKDPDLVEQNFATLQELPIPVVFKYISMLMWVVTWKFTYYSPNTFKELKLSQKTSWVATNWPKSVLKTNPVTIFQFAEHTGTALLKGRLSEAVFWPCFLLSWISVVAPMMAMVALPAATPLLLGMNGMWFGSTTYQEAAWRAITFAIIAEFMTNAHSFVIIACNHAGDDLYRYTTSCKAYSAEWLLRCAYSSANFECGTETIDILYGWLNYQVEHHMFPDMTPLQYRKLQPLMKSIFKKHGVQYVQQNVFLRVWKMFQVAVGDTKMQTCTALIDPGMTKGKDMTSMEIDMDKLIGG